MIHNRTTLRRAAPCRHGIMLLDMLLGIAALAVIMAGTLVLIAGLRQQRIVNHQHFLATQHLANLLEEIDAADLATKDPSTLSDLSLGDEVLSDLPGARLEVEIDRAALRENNNESGSVHSPRQVTCRLIWSAGDNAVAPYQTSLTMWTPSTEVGDNSAGREEDPP